MFHVKQLKKGVIPYGRHNLSLVGKSAQTGKETAQSEATGKKHSGDCPVYNHPYDGRHLLLYRR
jgi:hypothetical protein